MLDTTSIRKTAEAVIADMKVTGQRWPQDDDWFEPELCSVEMRFVKTVSPAVVLELLDILDKQSALLVQAVKSLRKTTGFYANGELSCSEHIQTIGDILRVTEISDKQGGKGNAALS